MMMMIMMIIITFCALDILILEFLPCKWQLVWNMLLKNRSPRLKSSSPFWCITIVFNFSKVPRKIEKNAYAKFWKDKKEYYGKFGSGLLLVCTFTPSKNKLETIQ